MDEFPTDPVKLKEACERYEKLLTDLKLTNFFRRDFFDVADLKKILEANQSEHVKVYYGIDEQNRHFLFLAPTQEDGRARDDIDTTAALCCCQRPPCPLEKSDRYAD
ncbi:hypothetical protein EXU85_25780 [Spirosoma sp. KCTC 42546]|uniref:hypothetical protein n=1 Tax=Spirosoma sp. KCTC 42546 TaxID=2520506 RepID=UPI001158BC95|nr:hypothetical protein [Spirosoma sp. KCTC 42546]QDK81835.1 hypothetical protein EXU85_25780 [Spirosoma sp. KCTC 42546]